MNFIEVVPKDLSPKERKLLFVALKVHSQDDNFDKFVDFFGRAVARYVIQKRQYEQRATDKEARSACDQLAKATRKLQGVWNQAPIEAHQRLNLAYQYQQPKGDSSEENKRTRITRSYTSAYTSETGPFFINLFESLESLRKTAELAATKSEKQKKGGQPLNPPLIFLARDIAKGLMDILDIRPSKTRDGALSQTLNLALDLVDDGSKKSDLSGFVRRAVNEIPNK